MLLPLPLPLPLPLTLTLTLTLTLEVEDDEEVDDAEEEVLNSGGEDSLSEGGEPEYEVREIIGHKVFKSVATKYWVWWKGHQKSEATLEPAEALLHAPGALEAYQDKIGASQASTHMEALRSECVLDRLSVELLGRLKGIEAQLETISSFKWSSYEENYFSESGDAIVLDRLAKTMPTDFDGDLEGLPSWGIIYDEVLKIFTYDDLQNIADCTIEHSRKSGYSGGCNLTPTNCDGHIILKYIGTWLYLGTKMKGGKLAVGKRGLPTLWSRHTQDDYYDPVVASNWTMSHFCCIQSHLSTMVPTSTKEDARSEHPGWKQIPLNSTVYANLETVVKLGEVITIDDTLYACRSKRGAPIITIKDKAAKHGLKEDEGGDPQSA